MRVGKLSRAGGIGEFSGLQSVIIRSAPLLRIHLLQICFDIDDQEYHEKSGVSI